MIITWEVEDGYIGKSRPQKTEVDDAELEACDTDEERDELIWDAIREDFNADISWCEIRRD